MTAKRSDKDEYGHIFAEKMQHDEAFPDNSNQLVESMWRNKKGNLAIYRYVFKLVQTNVKFVPFVASKGVLTVSQ